jgi:hypothetical protein
MLAYRVRHLSWSKDLLLPLTHDGRVGRSFSSLPYESADFDVVLCLFLIAQWRGVFIVVSGFCHKKSNYLYIVVLRLSLASYPSYLLFYNLFQTLLYIQCVYNVEHCSAWL